MKKLLKHLWAVYRGTMLLSVIWLLIFYLISLVMIGKETTLAYLAGLACALLAFVWWAIEMGHTEP